MSSKNEAASGGVGISGLLGVAFVVMKLCGVIDWSWWWVTAPFWMPVVILLIIAAACFAVFGVLYFMERSRK